MATNKNGVYTNPYFTKPVTETIDDVINSITSAKDQNTRLKEMEEELEREENKKIAQEQAASKSWSKERISNNIGNLLNGAEDVNDLQVPDINTTDDIGECEGFKELINAKIESGSSITGYRPELNAESYTRFESSKIKHDFLIDYKYKDIDSMKDTMKEYEDVNILYGYSQSFDALVGLSVEDGIVLKLKQVMDNYTAKYNAAIDTLSRKESRKLAGFKSTEITAAFAAINKTLKSPNPEVIITAVSSPVVSPSSTFPGIMKITNGSKYSGTENKSHSNGFGIDVSLGWNDSTKQKNTDNNRSDDGGSHYFQSIEDGEIIKIVRDKSIHTSINDKYISNYISIRSLNPQEKSKIKERVVINYRHVTALSHLKVGQIIPAGTKLGYYDHTGKTSGSHVHLDAEKNGQPMYLIPYIISIQPKLKMDWADIRSNRKVGIPVWDIYKKEQPEFYSMIMKQQLLKPTVVENQSGGTSSYYIKDNVALYTIVNNLLTLIRTKIDDLMQEVFHNSLSSLYQTYTYDFSRKVEDININITPGSSAKILMQGENAPVIQSTGGRTKSASVSFTITSISDLARLSMLFRVVDSTDHQISMLLMTRSIYKAGNNRTRMRYISEYMLQENFEKTIKDIIGKKIPPRFDEPVTIRNEFLNALGISTCIPTSLEIKTSDENPHTFSVIINFNAINLGNRNIENLKKQKVGSNIPILPLATRLKLEDTGNSSTVLNEKKLLSTVGLSAAKMAMAEFLPIYIISRLKILKDNIETMVANDTPINMDNVVDTCFLLSSKSVNENMSLVNKVIDDIYTRNMEADVNFNAWGEAAASVAANIGAIVVGFKTGNRKFTGTGKALRHPILSVKSIPLKLEELKEPVKQAIKNKAQLASTLVTKQTGSIIISSSVINAVIGGRNTGDPISDIKSENYLNFNLLSLLPVFLNDLIDDYLSHIKTNTINEFILSCANNTIDFMSTKNTNGNNNVISTFKKPVILKHGNNSKTTTGIRLFINGSDYSIDKGVEKAEALLGEAYARFGKNISQSPESAVNKLIHTSALALNYWSLSLAQQINKTLIDNGGSGPISAAFSEMNPANSGASEVEIGLYGIKTTAKLILNSSTGLYVNHIIEAINSIITSTNIDTLTGTFLKGTVVKLVPDDITKEEYNRNIRMTQILGNAICNKYSLGQEILSGNIITNKFASNEVRQFTSYAGRIIIQMLSQYMIAGKNMDGVNLPPMSETLKIILPDKSSAFYNSMEKFTITFAKALWEYGIIATIGVSIIIAILGEVAAAVTGIAVIITTFIIVILRAIKLLVEFGPFLWQFFLSAMEKGAKIILKKGNLLKISLYLTNLIRSGITHSTLIEIGVDTKIWFPELIYFGSDITEINGTSYIDFPIFSYMGEAMMPDFWVSKLGFLNESYASLMDSILSITNMVTDNYVPSSEENYKELLDRFKSRLTGIDSNAIQRAEIEFHNNLKYSLKEKYALPYFGPNYNESDTESATTLRSVATHISMIADITNKALLATIGKQIQGFNYGFIYIRVFTKTTKQILGESSKFKLTKEQCAFTIDVYPDKCVITQNDILSTIVNNLNQTKATDTIIDKSSSGNDLSAIYSEQMVRQTVGVINNLFTTLNTSTKTKTELTEALKEDTVTNLMMLKTLVGSSMSAVGLPGISNMKTLMSENARSMIRSALFLRAGYQYPTIKLFFIEEDDEAYYLFDDLYSYASIVDVSMSDDLDSPMQVLQLNVTNIFGHLDDISSDKNPEYTFSSDHEGASNLNSMMLKIGCKIKLQTGYSTLLDERCTIFTGRISNIQFGEITRIEATSMGDSFLEEISLEKVKIYGEDKGIGNNDYITKGLALVSSLIANNYVTNHFLSISDGSYKTPISTIKNIIGYVLTDATLKGKMDDYTISPELQTEFDSDIQLATSDYTASIKNKFFPNVLDHMFKSGGIDVKTSFNRQLFENINITNGSMTSISGGMDFILALRTKSTVWTSLNDTTWDVLQEINMLMPNNTIRVLPYETRSTLVWGGDDGYYRYKRGSEFKSMVATNLADKMRFSIESVPKFKTLLLQLDNNYALGTTRKIWSPFENTMALLALVVDYANSLAMAYSSSKSDGYTIHGINKNLDITKLNDPNGNGIQDILNWLYISLDYKFEKSVGILTANHKASIDNFNLALEDNIDDAKQQTFQNINIDDISTTGLVSPDGVDVEFRTIVNYDTTSGKGRDGITFSSKQGFIDWDKGILLKMLFLEFAAEYYMDLIYKLAASTSDSYKRISDVHMKVSGRDIISNNIILQEAYNAVKLTTPSEDMKDVISNLKEESREDAAPIPIHYKLEPRVWRVYSSFFRNINIFPSARNSIKAMYTASTLTNLIKQSYGGTITIFGDPNIKAGDKVFIYDENVDLYGFIEVQKIVTIFSQQQGYVSVITPNMIAKNESSLKEIITDILGNVLGTVKYIVLIGLLAKLGTNTIGVISRNKNARKFLDLINTKIDDDAVMKRGRWIPAAFNKLGKLIPGKASQEDEAILALNKYIKVNGKEDIDNFIRIVNEQKLAIENAITNEGKLETIIHNGITKMIDDINKNADTKIDISEVTLEKVKEILPKIIGDIFKQENRADKNISEMLIQNIQKETTNILTPLLPDTSVFTPNIQIENYIKNIALDLANPVTNKKLGYRNNTWFENINKKFTKLNKDTQLEGVEFKNGTPEEISLVKEGIKQLLERNTYNTTSIFEDASKLLVSAGKLGFGYMIGSELIDSVREFNDLYLTNSLTSNNVAITPLFFRGEPFISNLDGMDKQAGEKAGLFKIMGTRASSALRGLFSSMHDPWSDLNSRYNEILRETIGKENLDRISNNE